MVILGQRIKHVKTQCRIKFHTWMYILNHATILQVHLIHWPLFMVCTHQYRSIVLYLYIERGRSKLYGTCAQSQLYLCILKICSNQTKSNLFLLYRTTTVWWSMPHPFCHCMRWVTARRRGCRRLTDCNRWGRLSTPCRRSSTLTPKPRTTAASSSMTVKGIIICKT